MGLLHLPQSMHARLHVCVCVSVWGRGGLDYAQIFFLHFLKTIVLSNGIYFNNFIVVTTIFLDCVLI